MPNDRQRSQGTPILVQKRGAVRPQAVSLARRPFQREDIDEGWLQTLIHQHPYLLAVEEIEPDYAPLIPIGREVATDAGPIDNLYINPSGLITLVEAKLRKNPALTADKGSVAPEFWRNQPRITEALTKVPEFLDAFDTYFEAIKTP